MKPEYLTNQLFFFSNAKFILDFIKSKNEAKDSPAQFSLTTIRKMPESLYLPMDQHLLQLAIMNMEMPSFPPLDQTVKQVALSALFLGRQDKPSKSAILGAIEATRRVLIDSEAKNSPVKSARSEKTALDVFEQAAANYQRCQFFCHYDWRFAHWGTVEDIHSVVESTFELPTSYIEFKTKWTPPIPAMETLAGFFPSVRFELQYQYSPGDTWKKVEIFPNPPFSY